jgi:intron-binding protein aquarius
VITHSNNALNDIFEKITNLEINERYLLRLGMGEKDLNLEKDFSKSGRIDYMLGRRIALLSQVLSLANSLEVFTHQEYSCETAMYFYNFHIKSRIEDYKHNGVFYFAKYFGDYSKPQYYINQLEQIFKEISEIRAFELLRNNTERGNYLFTTQAKIIAMTCTYAALKRRDFIKIGLEYDNILIEEAGQILEVETFIPLLLQNNKDGKSRLKRVILIGDNNQLPPIVKNNAYRLYGNMDQSLYARFIRTQIPSINLDYQGRSRSSIVDLYRWRYKLHDLPHVLAKPQNNLFYHANAGFLNEYQFVNVDGSRGETSPLAYYYQNLAEAEYVVGTYMFMCLNGYDPNKITILTTYKGQNDLIKDIIKQKCEWNPYFKIPHKVTTVDKYQGQQNDYILLSLVRTKNVGHIRDVRRLVVALSRARLGLYIFGKWDLFNECFELKNSFNHLAHRPKELGVVLNEQFPTLRNTNDVSHIKVEDFKHMYRIVQELLKVKIGKN